MRTLPPHPHCNLQAHSLRRCAAPCPARLTQSTCGLRQGCRRTVNRNIQKRKNSQTRHFLLIQNLLGGYLEVRISNASWTSRGLRSLTGKLRNQCFRIPGCNVQNRAIQWICIHHPLRFTPVTKIRRACHTESDKRPPQSRRVATSGSFPLVRGRSFLEATAKPLIYKSLCELAFDERVRL